MTTLTPHYTRDLPYDYASLVENVCDPSHVPFSHHGVMGDRWGGGGAAAAAGGLGAVPACRVPRAQPGRFAALCCTGWNLPSPTPCIYTLVDAHTLPPLPSMRRRDKQTHGMWDLRRGGPLATLWDAAFGEITITFRPPGLITYHSRRKQVRRQAGAGGASAAAAGPKAAPCLHPRRQASSIAGPCSSTLLPPVLSSALPRPQGGESVMSFWVTPLVSGFGRRALATGCEGCGTGCAACAGWQQAAGTAAARASPTHHAIPTAPQAPGRSRITLHLATDSADRVPLPFRLLVRAAWAGAGPLAGQAAWGHPRMRTSAGQRRTLRSAGNPDPRARLPPKRPACPRRPRPPAAGVAASLGGPRAHALRGL